MGGGDRERGASRLPGRLTLLSLGLGLLLFMTTTAPVWNEGRRLRDVLAERQKLRDLLDERNTELQCRTEALEWDLQALLVEIDRQGMTPDELLDDREQHPAAPRGKSKGL
jgi:hypothetical protein